LFLPEYCNQVHLQSELNVFSNEIKTSFLRDMERHCNADFWGIALQKTVDSSGDKADFLPNMGNFCILARCSTA
jgi:hypothetical protein